MLNALLHGELVALETEIGPIYVRPDCWERLHMIWTFRHFRTLPRQVLSRRQQVAIEGLCRSAVVTPEEVLHEHAIIGKVENVPVMAGLRSTVGDIAVASAVSVPVKAGAAKPSGPKRALQKAESAVAAPAATRIASRGAHRRPEPKAGAAKSISLSESRASWPAWVFAAAAISVAIVSGPARSHLARQRPFLPASDIAAQSQPAASPAATNVHPAPALQEIPRPEPTLLVSDVGEWAIPLLPLPMDTPAMTTGTSPEARTEAVAAPSARLRRLQGAKADGSRQASLPAELNVVERPGAPEERLVRPDYPPGRASGTVMLRALVNSAGRVQSVNVLSGNRTLAQAAANAVKSWRYRPYQVNGAPVPFQTRVLFHFTAGEIISINFPTP